MKARKSTNFFFVMLLIGLCGCTSKEVTRPRARLELIAEGFTSPVALLHPEDGSGRLFVVDQTGLIWILAGGQRLEQPFLDLRERVVDLNSFYDERGLLGLAFIRTSLQTVVSTFRTAPRCKQAYHQRNGITPLTSPSSLS